MDIANLTPEQKEQLIFESDVLYDLDLVWEPHKGQEQIMVALFIHCFLEIFIECGRKFGKSEFLIYCLYRYALLNPNSACYYIAPFQKQAKELIWANNRLQNFFMPKIDPKTGLSHKGYNRSESFQVFEEFKEKYGIVINNTEMRIKFGNGSFIKLDGSDQYESYRGINPHIIAYDEYKDFHPRFHEGMEPNLATFNAPIVKIGTPAVGDEANAHNFNIEADYCNKAPDLAYFNLPTWCNPWISKDWLRKKRAELIAKGKEDTWQREYEAKRVKGGSRSIFPMFDTGDALDLSGKTKYTKHIKPHKDVTFEVFRRWKDWNFYLVFDPASASTFGVLFLAIHKRTKKVAIIDEIYEKDKAKMSTRGIFPRARRMVLQNGISLEHDVDAVYDNAATWFRNEVAVEYDYGLIPCTKDVSKKEERLNLIKDILLVDGLFICSDKCTNFSLEMQGYRTDENGKIPKENDHLIDCFRYGLAQDSYDTVPEDSPIVLDERRGYTIDNDPIIHDRGLADPFAHLTEDLYE